MGGTQELTLTSRTHRLGQRVAVCRCEIGMARLPERCCLGRQQRYWKTLAENPKLNGISAFEPLGQLVLDAILQSIPSSVVSSGSFVDNSFQRV